MGKFQLLDNDKILDEDVMRSDMLTKLLVYILMHRDYPITIQELSEALWDEDETENPAGALKNLMYRLRNLLKKNLGDEDYILTSRGVYYWNSEISVWFDAEQFEEYCDLAKKAEDPKEKISIYEKAIELYQGDFMPKITDKHWVVTLSAYYHSMLLSAVKALAEIYMSEERFEEAEQLCADGLKYDSVDEWLHCHRITALMRQNKQKLAMECYEQAVKVLYNALGVRKSAELEKVHQELLKMSKGSEAEEMESVHKDMQEEKEPEGAYICGYPVFREIYRLEARKISRLGESEYIMLLTLQMKEATGAGNHQMEKFMINQAMNQVEGILKEALRIGDVAARYSDSQFVVLLPTCTYEGCLLVADRILKRFHDKNKGKRVVIKPDFEEVTTSSSTLIR
uniref:BTAD domain-containing putative transcriptional regulator n=1 Tax=Acetatifactor sp. TaxID=1872090 RepID=UPI0040578D39